MTPDQEHIANDTRCTQCGGACVPASVDEEMAGKYMELLEQVAESGLIFSAISSKVDRDRVIAINYLRKHHRHLRFEPRHLDEIPAELKQECRVHMEYVLGSDPDVLDRIKEVFKARKKSRAKHEKRFSVERY